MGRVNKFFGNPGIRPALHYQASIPAYQSATTFVEKNEKVDEDTTVKCESELMEASSLSSVSDGSTTIELSYFKIQSNGTFEMNRGFTGLNKGYMDIGLDRMVYFAGSQVVFYCVWVIIIIWVILGAVYSAPFNWQVVMQDGQSIQCYIWDTLLMRQQLTSTHEQLLVCCQLRSRLESFKSFCSLETIRHKLLSSTKDNISLQEDDTEIGEKKLGQLPVENWYDRVSTWFAVIIGSVSAMIVFWIGIFVWVGCGAIPQSTGNTAPFTGRTSGSNPELEAWSDGWQMDINTAVAVSLLICTTFLQNIRARHDKFIAKVLIEIFQLDENIDVTLRASANDFKTNHPVITIPSVNRSRLQKVIDWYADVIGTGIGVVIAIIAFGVWIGIGSPLKWNDDWWLIIGTYTGLVGFIDGFVLREVYHRSIKHEEYNYKKVIDEDLELIQLLGITNAHALEQENSRKQVTNTLDYKISDFVNKICSNQYSVVVGALIVIGLICAASGMKWTTTGQLIANTPTMIIEEFFLIVLIQAHNWADEKRRIEVSTLLAHRHIIYNHLNKHMPLSTAQSYIEYTK